ncbi:hypothetical protein NQ317_006667 [Molorchus minor]|uniref:Uncharacterized protein n=1 Tax=Molorchus minor TaxID=1323400 RepID=A0ABQ9JX72_9CUCU|nr:hypothetical protein NQ317_006667 [Molorchus minor]
MTINNPKQRKTFEPGIIPHIIYDGHVKYLFRFRKFCNPFLIGGASRNSLKTPQGKSATNLDSQ